MPVPCCGRRKQDCRCYDSGAGLRLKESFKRSVFDTLVRAVRGSRIQTWRDTADMPQYAEQVKCKKLTDLFPMAFMWRHFSNPHLWKAFMKNKAVKQHGPPSWTLVRSTLEIFARNKQPIHGGLFYSGNVGRIARARA